MFEIENLSKSIGHKKVLKDLSLTLPEYGVVGLIGSNGSGKTTLLKTLVGLYPKYKGHISINKNDIAMNPRREDIINLKVYEIVEIYESLYKHFNTERCETILTKLNINQTRYFSEFSKGNQQSIILALTLSREVPVYLFDEPFSGLDIYLRKSLIEQIIEFCDTSKHLVIISSHHVELIERVIDHALFLEKGQIIDFISINELEKKFSLKEHYYQLVLGGDES